MIWCFLLRLLFGLLDVDSLDYFRCRRNENITGLDVIKSIVNYFYFFFFSVCCLLIVMENVYHAITVLLTISKLLFRMVCIKI